MPARSKAQQKAAGAALSAKRGQTSKTKLRGASRSMVNSMTEKQLEEFAGTKRKGLPKKKTAAASRKRPAAKKATSKRASTARKSTARKTPARKRKSPARKK